MPSTRITKPKAPSVGALYIREVPPEIRQRISSGAGARRMAQAQFIAALLTLHDDIRALADGDDDWIAGAYLQERLTALGIQTVGQ